MEAHSPSPVELENDAEEVEAGEEADAGEEAEAEAEPQEDAASASRAAAAGKSSGPDLRRVKKLRGLMLTKYESVLSTAEAMRWTALPPEEEEANDWHVTWSDTSVSFERVSKMSRMQKINHFPGMLELVRKAGTARNLNKMLKAIGKDYKFFPRTFMLPADYTELKKEFGEKSRGNKTFIIKPSKGCQGTGIMLTRSLDAIDPSEPNIVQRYMHRPHLLDGYKYDLRLYVLVTACSPLRAYLFDEGLVRMCTEKYAMPTNANLDKTCTHLTNYSINKDSDAFVQPEDIHDDSSHKRTITSLMETLRSHGHDTAALWEAIGSLVVKTMVSVQPHLEHTYFTCRQRSDDAGFGCFEVLGFDVMFDHKLNPMLIEINHSPSFTCDSPLDETVKSALLKGTLQMVSFGKDEHKTLRRAGPRLDPKVLERLVRLRQAYEAQHCEACGFQRIYPLEPTEGCATPQAVGSSARAAELMAQYESYLAVAAELYGAQSLAGSRRTTSNCGAHALSRVPAPSSWGPAPPQSERLSHGDPPKGADKGADGAPIKPGPQTDRPGVGRPPAAGKGEAADGRGGARPSTPSGRVGSTSPSGAQTLRRRTSSDSADRAGAEAILRAAVSRARTLTGSPAAARRPPAGATAANAAAGRSGGALQRPEGAERLSGGSPRGVGVSSSADRLSRTGMVPPESWTQAMLQGQALHGQNLPSPRMMPAPEPPMMAGRHATRQELTVATIAERMAADPGRRVPASRPLMAAPAPPQITQFAIPLGQTQIFGPTKVAQRVRTQPSSAPTSRTKSWNPVGPMR